MPTRYPQKNSIEQIFLEHLQRAEMTNREQGCCCLQEFKKHIIQYGRQTGKSTMTRHYCLEIKMCMGEKKRAERRKESTVLVRENRANRGRQICRA